MTIRNPDRSRAWTKVFMVSGVVLAAAAWISPSPARATDLPTYAATEVSAFVYNDYLENRLYTRPGNNRGYDGWHHDPARDSIVAILNELGLNPTLETFSWSGNTYANIVAVKAGSYRPHQQFVLTAHYDSYNNPGADDDASGVALLLETARVLTRYDSAYTLRFIVFDLNEQSLAGSIAYRNAHPAEHIVGLINADQIAYNTGPNTANLFGDYCSTPLRNALAAALGVYGGGLGGVVGGAGPGSDHTSFAARTIPALHLAEAQIATNPYNHYQTDHVYHEGNINWDYAVKMTRGVVGFLADRAGSTGVTFTFPDGQPQFIAPGGGTTLRVALAPAGLTPLEAPPQLHWNSGDGWNSAVMTTVSPLLYQGAFPAVPCGRGVDYYISCETVEGVTATSPPGGPANCWRTIAGVNPAFVLDDNGESDAGWTVSGTATAGHWQRGVPNWGGINGTPRTDFDGSGRCHLTGNSPTNKDVDGGYTDLTSPPLDLDGREAEVRFALWYTNYAGGNPNSDTFRVMLSNNNGGSWTDAMVVGPTSQCGWTEHRLRIAEFVTPTASVRLRFRASDTQSPSLVEAGVDAVQILSWTCDAGCSQPADGDLDQNGVLDGRDIGIFVNATLLGGTPEQVCRGDFSGDGQLGSDDVPGLVVALLAG